jgi:hypothetical protein
VSGREGPLKEGRKSTAGCELVGTRACGWSGWTPGAYSFLWILPSHSLLFRAVPCCVVLCRAVLCCAVLCCDVLCACPEGLATLEV